MFLLLHFVLATNAHPKRDQTQHPPNGLYVELIAVDFSNVSVTLFEKRVASAPTAELVGLSDARSTLLAVEQLTMLARLAIALLTSQAAPKH